MGTRCDIIVEHTNGKWKRIYCHWDGYIEGVGAMLLEYYNTQERAEEVVVFGDMSSLRENCNKPIGHTFDNPVKGYTIYYGRDRNEVKTLGKIGETLSEVWPESDTWTEFTYVWKLGEGWLVGDPDEGSQTLKSLSEILSGKEEQPKTNIKTPWGVIGNRK